ncbi:DUF4139 domain-containing protein [Novosphingobium lentum]|uniref:DUF4139 domain-containing protein n=1 Tax=Novosphingobium lentum TaxID=145287 RepID=UPI000834BF84|nr:DUF4139 domain-containing protein [Novosphingobium lentum]
MRLTKLLVAEGLLACGLLGAPGAGEAQSAPAPNAQGDLAVTIYSSMALVQDVRQVSLPQGRSRQEFADVSAQIRPETVTLSGDGFGVVEQNFDYDLLSPSALMEKAVGQQVTLLRTNPATGAETRERATVLAANGGVVLKIGDRIEVLRDDGLPVRVIFDAIPPNLRARPTLSVTMDASRGGSRPLTLSYLTPGMGWKSDYVALFDEKAGKIDVQGWITLTNNTGTTFNNARALLVAGDVGQVQQGYNPGYGPRRSMPRGNQPGTESGGGEQLGDFHVYPIEGRTTIANAQTKQVSFLNAAGVPARKGYEFRNGWLGSQGEAQSASSILKFSNAKAEGIGAALPAGTVRVYMRDARGQAQFIGESQIPHTPGGSSLALRTGDAFDVKVQPVLEKREAITTDEWEKYARWKITYPDGKVSEGYSEAPKTFYRTQMRYIVTNARPVPVTVDVVQDGLASWWWWRDVRVPVESLPGVQDNADSRHWEVPVPANGRTELTVTFLTPW